MADDHPPRRRYPIHHEQNAGRAKAGDNPPTFHEITSPSVRVWQAHGTDVKGLAGHKTDAMSAPSQDARGSEWVTVSQK